MKLQVWPTRENARMLVARFRIKGRDAARDLIRHIESELVPPGYVLDDERIHKDRSGSGGATLSVTMVIFHRDSREPAVSPGELRKLWEHAK